MPRDPDRPMWRGQRPWFEIWFAVLLDAGRRRALWIRQTLFVPRHGDGRTTIWGAWFDADASRPTHAAKRYASIEHAKIGEGDRLIQIDDSWMSRGAAVGSVEDLAWDVTWSGGRDAHADVPTWLPAPTHAKPIVYDADASGRAVVSGRVVELRGRATAMHLWGKRRVPTLQWLWSPWTGDASLEVQAVSLRDRLSMGFATLRLDGPPGEPGASSGATLRGRPATAAHASCLVTATVAGPRRLVHARAWAEPAQMVGYAYRDTDGRDLMVAQSDIGSAFFEVYTRTAPGAPWKQVDERRAAGGVAVEIHQHAALPEVDYIAWDETTHRAGAAVAGAAADAATAAAGDAPVRASAAPAAANAAPAVAASAAAKAAPAVAASTAADAAAAPAGIGAAVAATRLSVQAVRSPPTVQSVQPVQPDLVEWPEVTAIVALGLTYGDHVRETGRKLEANQPPTSFTKHLRAFSPGDGTVRVPDGNDVLAALEAVEPGIAAVLRDKLQIVPAVMDYEGELALVALDAIDDALLTGGMSAAHGVGDARNVGGAGGTGAAHGASGSERVGGVGDARSPRSVAGMHETLAVGGTGRTPLSFGLAVANDLTARFCQVLGETMEQPLAYWACAKSFPGFLPVAARVWAPPGGIERLPELTLETRVNGELRQQASTKLVIYDLIAMVRAARMHLGRPLVRGDVILTGTPAGVGLRLSPLKRRVAALVKDRFRKAELLASTFATSTALLRPGDVVEVDAGPAGRVRTRLTL